MIAFVREAATIALAVLMLFCAAAGFGTMLGYIREGNRPQTMRAFLLTAAFLMLSNALITVFIIRSI